MLKDENRKRGLALLFFLSMIFMLIATIYGANAFSTHEADTTPVRAMNNGWSADGTAIEMLPATLPSNGGDSLTMAVTLPEELPNHPTLCFPTRYWTVEASINGESIYAYALEDNSPVGYIAGSIWNVISLPENSGGQGLTLRFSSPNSGGVVKSWALPEIMIGSQASVDNYLGTRGLPLAIFVLCHTFFAGLMLIFSLFLWLRRMNFNRRGFFLLGLFVLLASLWVFTDSNMAHFFTYNRALLYLLNFFSLMLMPIPFLLFLRELCRRWNFVLDLLCLLFVVNLGINTTLYFTGTVDLIQTQIITQMLLAVTMVTTFILCASERLHFHSTGAAYVLAGICLLCIGGLISVIDFALGSTQDNSLFFRLGLTLFIVLTCTGSCMRGMELLRSSLKAETYRLLAYTDNMTGLGNRAAFEREIDKLEGNAQFSTLTLVMFDINGLKHINDLYGHYAGDNLIQSAANCIIESLGDLGKCFRLGGDEFVVLLKDISADVLESALKNFESDAEKCDCGNPEGLHVAWGHATGEPAPDLVHCLYREADKQMYSRKKGS